MITAVDLLVHLEAKADAALAAGEESLSAYLEEVARFVREIAEAALVAGDEVSLREARRLALKLGSYGFGAPFPLPMPPAQAAADSVRTCPRCGQRFSGPAGPFERVGTLLCGDCAGELLAGIRF